MKRKAKYRKVKIELVLNTAADLEYLKDRDEWERVFAWMKPGDAFTDQEKMKVISVRAK